MRKPEPLLDFSLIEPERPFIRIDGTNYELAMPEDFGIIERARLEKLQRRAAELHQRVEDLSEEDAAELVRVVEQLVALVVPTMPADVRSRLRDLHKLRIIEVFLRAVGALKEPITPPPLNQWIGESSSPDSSDSMAETSTAG